MNWRWEPHVHAVMHEQDLVLLDVRSSSYLVLADAEGVVDLAGEGDRARIQDTDLTDQLIEARLGSAGDAPGAPRRRACAAARDLDPASIEPVSAIEALGLLASALSLLWRFKLRRLERLVAEDHDPAITSPEAVRRVVRRALVFRRLLPWIPFQGQCLYRAALLRQYLGRDRGLATWVFGVTTWPLAAHCWLQVDGLVLNDRLDQVQRYTPILAV